MIGNIDYDSDSCASRYARVYPLDTLAGVSMMSVYCPCGRIVVLDRSEMRVRLSLGKELECTSCRNRRISREIDAMEDHFNGIEEAEGILRGQDSPPVEINQFYYVLINSC